MSTFTEYLTESAKSYDYKIKIAGDIDKNFATKMETALGKFEVSKMSAGKKTPIQSLPLDFPALKNESVTIFDVTTNYPANVRELSEYIADYMRISPACVVVRKPGEPTEEYQEQITNATKSEYKNKLQDIEYSEHAKIDPADFHSSKANMSLLKELLKDREKPVLPEQNKESLASIKGLTTKEDEAAMSPLSKSTNPHPDPKRK